MYNADKQDKFIELRAQGWSLNHIATELDVSKRTLVDWNREFAKDVQSLRALELELLKEKIVASHEENVNRLTRLQKTSTTNWPIARSNTWTPKSSSASPSSCARKSSDWSTPKINHPRP